MKTTYKKLMFTMLALLAVGAAKVSAATETYDFTNRGTTEGTVPDWGSDVTAGSQSLQMLALGSETFGNRFACGPKRSDANVFKFRDSGNYHGLYSLYDNRYFSILNLKAGDKVTLTLNASEANITFANGTTVVSKQEYTVEEDGTMDFVSTGKVWIEKVVIKTPTASETVAIGQTLETYNLEAISKPTSITAIDPITADDTKYSRFSTQQQNCFQISGSGWGWQVNYDKWFSINNLKAGDKVWIRYTKSDGQTVNFEDATLIGETGTVELESETWYTLAKDADKLKLVNQVNTNGYKANYLEVKIMSINDAVTDGTLVSSTALDFTGTAVSAYYASAANAGTVTLTQINKVAAGTPIYIKAASAGTYEIPALSDAADATTGNLLKGSATNTTSLQSTEDAKYYVFGVLKGEAGFYPVGTSKTLTSAAGKAYLQLTADQAAAAAARISIVFADGSETTGISTAEVSTAKEDNIWYTLQGVRVAQPTRGIYVRNGKKVFVK